MLPGMWGEIKAQIASECIDLEWAWTCFYAPGHCRKGGIFKAPHKVTWELGFWVVWKKLCCKARQLWHWHTRTFPISGTGWVWGPPSPSLPCLCHWWTSSLSPLSIFTKAVPAPLILLHPGNVFLEIKGQTLVTSQLIVSGERLHAKLLNLSLGIFHT